MTTDAGQTAIVAGGVYPHREGAPATGRGSRGDRRFQFDREQVARYLAAGNVLGARVHCALYGQDFHELAGILEDALTKHAETEARNGGE